MKTTSTIPEDLQKLQALRTGLPAAKQKALGQIGFTLLAQEKDHFNQLSRTGSSNGVNWPRVTPQTAARRRSLQARGILATADPEQIGVLTGRLSKSFRFRVTGDQVTLSNTAPHANAFAARRPLFPISIPPPWMQRAEAITQWNLDQLANLINRNEP